MNESLQLLAPKQVLALFRLPRLGIGPSVIEEPVQDLSEPLSIYLTIQLLIWGLH